MSYVYPPRGWSSPESPELDAALQACTSVADAEFSFNCADWPDRRGTRAWREASDSALSAHEQFPEVHGQEFATSYTHPFDEQGRERDSWALFFAPDMIGETIECHLTLARRSCVRRDLAKCFEDGWADEEVIA